MVFLLVVAVSMPFSAAAEGLLGRMVTLRTETRVAGLTLTDDAPAQEARITENAEFDIGGPVPGTALYIVPVRVDLGSRWIEFTYYPGGVDQFLEADFNGYVFEFQPGCAELDGATVNPNASSVEVTDADLVVEPNRLTLDVSGRVVTDGSRIVIDIDVGDCVAA